MHRSLAQIRLVAELGRFSEQTCGNLDTKRTGNLIQIGGGLFFLLFDQQSDEIWNPTHVARHSLWGRHVGMFCTH